MKLKDFLKSMSVKEREAFAKRCNSNAKLLTNIAYDCKPCAEWLAIEIEKHSDRQVTCEELRPDVNWKYLRGTAPEKSAVA